LYRVGVGIVSANVNALEDGATRTEKSLIAPWIGWVSAGVLVALIGIMVSWSISANGGFAYPIDDAYIHLRLGQNLADSGTLGINPGEFASAGSSTVWPVLIGAVVAVTGPLVGIPLVLSTLCAVVTLVLLDRWASHQRLSVPVRIGLMVAMIFVVPLLLMALTGMEHVLQIGLSILLVNLGVRASLAETSTPRQLLALGGASLALSATRPEVIFVLAAVGVLLALQRRWPALLAAGTGAAVPFLVNAAVNIGQGWPALPASIMAKSVAESSGIARFLPDPGDIADLRDRPRLIAVALLLAIVLWLAHRIGDRFDAYARRFGWVALSITVAHIAYSQTGWLFRYEAYLVALCVCAIALGSEILWEQRSHLAAGFSKWQRRAVMSTSLILVLAALWAGLGANRLGLTGMKEIYQQQGHMAQFSAEACPGCRSVIGDIGMVGLYGETRLTDSYGLANLQVLEAKMDGDYDADEIEQIALDEGAQWAMVYTTPQNGTDPPPESWVKVGEWVWSDTSVVASNTVSFFVIDQSVESRIREHFESFPAPPGATVRTG
jgi:hypothetical protein